MKISVYKRIVLFLMMLCVLLGSMYVPAYADNSEPTLRAEAAVLIDAKNGNVLYNKNADKKMYPASTTKVMTALVALEKVKNGEISLEQPITYTKTADDTMAADGSNIGLKVGETMVLGDLLKGLLIASGNDAAAIIAEHIGGSIDAFVGLMNDKASSLGLKNTKFANPHGLHNTEHYTTASDMAKIAREAMKDETFRSIVECAHIRLSATNMNEERYYINTNNLVSKMRYPYYFYDKAIGIKTGSTTEAGYCLVSAAADKEKEVIAVVFKTDAMSVSHEDSKRLLEYGITGFSNVRFAKLDDIYGEVAVKQAADGTDHVLLSAKANLEILFPKNVQTSEVETIVDIPDKVYAPIKKGQEIGKVSFVYNSQTIGSVALVSTVDVKRHILGFLMSFGEWIWKFRTVKIIVYTAIAVILIFIVLLVIGFAQALKKSKSKKRRKSSYRPPRY